MLGKNATQRMDFDILLKITTLAEFEDFLLGTGGTNIQVTITNHLEVIRLLSDEELDELDIEFRDNIEEEVVVNRILDTIRVLREFPTDASHLKNLSKEQSLTLFETVKNRLSPETLTQLQEVIGEDAIRLQDLTKNLQNLSDKYQANPQSITLSEIKSLVEETQLLPPSVLENMQKVLGKDTSIASVLQAFQNPEETVVGKIKDQINALKTNLLQQLNTNQEEYVQRLSQVEQAFNTQLSELSQYQTKANDYLKEFHHVLRILEEPQTALENWEQIDQTLLYLEDIPTQLLSTVKNSLDQESQKIFDTIEHFQQMRSSFVEVIAKEGETYLISSLKKEVFVAFEEWVHPEYQGLVSTIKDWAMQSDSVEDFLTKTKTEAQKKLNQVWITALEAKGVADEVVDELSDAWDQVIANPEKIDEIFDQKMKAIEQKFQNSNLHLNPQEQKEKLVEAAKYAMRLILPSGAEDPLHLIDSNLSFSMRSLLENSTVLLATAALPPVSSGIYAAKALAYLTEKATRYLFDEGDYPFGTGDGMIAQGWDRGKLTTIEVLLGEDYKEFGITGVNANEFQIGMNYEKFFYWQEPRVYSPVNGRIKVDGNGEPVGLDQGQFVIIAEDGTVHTITGLDVDWFNSHEVKAYIKQHPVIKAGMVLGQLKMSGLLHSETSLTYKIQLGEQFPGYQDVNIDPEDYFNHGGELKLELIKADSQGQSINEGDSEIFYVRLNVDLEQEIMVTLKRKDPNDTNLVLDGGSDIDILLSRHQGEEGYSTGALFVIQAAKEESSQEDYSNENSLLSFEVGGQVLKLKGQLVENNIEIEDFEKNVLDSAHKQGNQLYGLMTEEAPNGERIISSSILNQTIDLTLSSVFTRKMN
ncbi:hypothetical protein WDW89_19040 [Deltaproteobacteria bacterium TL4]